MPEITPTPSAEYNIADKLRDLSKQVRYDPKASGAISDALDLIAAFLDDVIRVMKQVPLELENGAPPVKPRPVKRPTKPRKIKATPVVKAVE